MAKVHDHAMRGERKRGGGGQVSGDEMERKYGMQRGEEKTGSQT